MKMVALGEVAELNPKSDAVPADQEVSFVGMAQLDAATAETEPGMTRRFVDVSKGYTVFRDLDLLVAKITPCFENNKIGQARLKHKVGIGSTEFHVVRPGNRLSDRYLLHYLRQDWIRAQGELRMTGSAGQRRVPAAYLAGLTIPLPPLPEQHRIAAILDHADALRAKWRQVIARLENLEQSIFLDMFGDPESCVASSNTVRFGNIAELQGGRNLVADDEQTASKYRVLKISAVTSGRFKPSESKPLPVDYQPPEAHLVRQGDLLISRANTTELVGAVAYVAAPVSNYVLPDKVWRFVWRDPDSVPLYYQSLFRTPSIRRRISQLSSGTGGSMKNISKAKIEQLELPAISVQKQREFARRVTAIPGADLAELDDLFASLQSRAFRGEL